MQSVTDSFYDEVAGGEPSAVILGIGAGGDAVGQLAIVVDGDVVEPDAVPTVAQSAVGRGLVDVKRVDSLFIAGTLFGAAEGRELDIAAHIAHSGNLFGREVPAVGVVRLDEDVGEGAVGLSCAHHGRDAVAAWAQVAQRGLCLEALTGLALHFEIACLRVAAVVFANGSERGLCVVHRLVAEFPEVAVQVVLVALAQAVCLYRRVSLSCLYLYIRLFPENIPPMQQLFFLIQCESQEATRNSSGIGSLTFRIELKDILQPCL